MYKIKAKRQAYPISIRMENGDIGSYMIKTGEEVVVERLSPQLNKLKEIGLIDARPAMGTSKGLKKLKLA